MTADFAPEIDSRKCTGCVLCVRHCPQHALASVDNCIIISNPGACDYCGVCQNICPTGAISLTYEIVFS